MPFRTRINLQDNRQHYHPAREPQVLSGITEFGVPYSGLTTGPDPNNSGTTGSIINVISTFSGNTGTTVFTFGDSRMDIAQGQFSAITNTTSAITQNSGNVFVGNTSQIVDGNLSYLDYTGVSFDILVSAITETSPGIFTGTVVSDDVFFLSADTLDFTGRTIWVDVKGITKTKKLIVTDGAQTGYVLTALNTSGDTEWVSLSGISANTNIYTTGATLIGTTLVFDRTDSSSAFTADLSALSSSSVNTFWVSGDSTESFKSIYGTNLTVSGQYSFIGGGENHTISGTSGIPRTAIIAGIGHNITGNGISYDNIILGGSSHKMDSSSGLIGKCGLLSGNKNQIYGSVTNSAIIGGELNQISDTNSIILGGEQNNISGNSSLIGCGVNNIITSSHSAILGGNTNKTTSNRTGILGGLLNNILSGTSDDSVIVGGSGNTINSGATRSVIIGGQNITGTSSDMVYVPDLVIDGLTSTDPIATDANGMIVAGTSDRRLKKNINPLNGGLDKIRKLQGVSFEYTEESNMGGGIRYGFIAQDVQEVIPEMVRKRAKGDGMLTLNYDEVIPWMVEAIKDIVDGETTITNTTIQTQTITAEDNFIELNYGGTHESSVGGGITVKNGVKEGVNSFIKIDENGRWVVGPSLTTSQLTLPEYTPKSSTDEIGSSGDVVWDDKYLYIKRNTGWGRCRLEDF